MAIQIVQAVRTSRVAVISTAVDAGAGAGELRIKAGGTILSVSLFSDPAFGAAAAGQITSNPISLTNAIATGTANQFDVRDSNGTTVFSGTAGTSGTDLILDTTSITLGDSIAIAFVQLTEGNL